MTSWNKKKEIEGVSSSSIVSLKSIVTNEELLSKNKESGDNNQRVKKTKLDQGIKGGSNKGISARIQKDIEATETDTKTLDNSHRALIAKTKIYQKLSNNYNSEFEKNQDILVDFLGKEDRGYNNNNSNNSNNYSNNNVQQQQQQQRNNSYKQSYNPDYDEMRSLWEQEKYKNDLNDNYYGDDYDDEEDEEDEERKRKDEKIREMVREEEMTKSNRDRVHTAKVTSQQQKLDRLQQIQQKRKLALLKQKQLENQQQK